MRLSGILPALLALPLMAQQPLSIGLTYDSQNPKNQTLDSVQISAKTNSSFGLTFGYTPWTFGSSALAITAAYRFKGTSDLTVKTPSLSGATADYKHEYTALGLQVSWRKPLDFGFGLQCRFEKTSIEGKEGGRPWAGNTARPWLNGQIGYTFAPGGVSPYVALVAAIPLTCTSKPTTPAVDEATAQANQDQLAKSMAPQFEFGIQVGLRF